MYDFRSSKKIVIFTGVVAFHAIVIAIFLANSPRTQEQSQGTAFTLILLKPESKPTHFQSMTPSPLVFTQPDIKIQALPSFSIEKENSFDTYSNARIYEPQQTRADETIFDPRIRELLREHAIQNGTTSNSRLNTWTNNNGDTFADMGDGECIKSMQKIGNERGTQWSTSRVKCGKSDSERMMENVERSLKKK